VLYRLYIDEFIRSAIGIKLNYTRIENEYQLKNELKNISVYTAFLKGQRFIGSNSYK